MDEACNELLGLVRFRKGAEVGGLRYRAMLERAAT